MENQINPELSIIVPLYNESDNVPELYKSLLKAIGPIGKQFEIIMIDDGSDDATWDKINEIAEKDKRIKAILFTRNFGQTAALSAGIDIAEGDVIVTIDGDMQNDPNDIPMMLKKIEEGYDVVSGWRKSRKDRFITRIIPSVAANSFISYVSGVKLHDYGCTLKAYKKEVIKKVKLYGEMHRFIPIYACWHTTKLIEVPVSHFPRKRGKSKYGMERIVKVLLDLIVVKFLSKYSQKPIYIFGGLGVVSIILGFIVGLYTVYLKLFQHTSFIQTPLPNLCVLLFVLGFNSILMGLLAELTVRTYYEAQNKPTYEIKEKVNLT